MSSRVDSSQLPVSLNQPPCDPSLGSAPDTIGVAWLGLNPPVASSRVNSQEREWLG